MVTRAWVAAFLTVSLANVGAEAASAPLGILLTKPLLLPTLAAAYWSAVPSPHTATDRTMLLAFAGSFVGDVALMLAPTGPADHEIVGIPKHDLWFLVGVAGFFVCHLALLRVYRAVHLPERGGAPALLPERWPLALPIVAYGAGILAFLAPKLAADPARAVALIPVLGYGAVLMTMVLMALNRYGRVPSRSFWATFLGAVVFLLSDSIIALAHLAKVPIPAPGVAIMVTYLAAEAGIALGVVWERRGDH